MFFFFPALVKFQCSETLLVLFSTFGNYIFILHMGTLGLHSRVKLDLNKIQRLSRFFLLCSQPLWRLTALIWIKHFICVIRSSVTLRTFDYNSFLLSSQHKFLLLIQWLLLTGKNRTKTISGYLRFLLIIWSSFWVHLFIRTDFCFLCAFWSVMS